MTPYDLEQRHDLVVLQVNYLPLEIYPDPDEPKQYVTSVTLDPLCNVSPVTLLTKFHQLVNVDIDWSDPDHWLPRLAQCGYEFLLIVVDKNAAQEEFDTNELMEHPRTMFILGDHPSVMLNQVSLHTLQQNLKSSSRPSVYKH